MGSLDMGWQRYVGVLHRFWKGSLFLQTFFFLLRGKSRKYSESYHYRLMCVYAHVCKRDLHICKRDETKDETHILGKQTLIYGKETHIYVKEAQICMERS